MSESERLTDAEIEEAIAEFEGKIDLWRAMRGEPPAVPTLLRALRQQQAEIVALRAENTALRAAVRKMMIGGNHLALYLGHPYPHYTASHNDGLLHYQAGSAYDSWCCWKAIMEARDALEEVGILD